MNIKTYKDQKEELINKIGFKKEEIFEYEFSPLKDEFDWVFKFYQENLKKNVKYGITPALIFFNTNLSINAWAGKNKGYYIISFNMGTIVRLIQLFIEKLEVFYSDEDQFSDFEKLLDNPVNVLMYQNAIHFTFYHEMAHLVQQSELLNDKIYEKCNEADNYSEIKHILELDADEFSALSIGGHILRYAETTFGDKINSSQFEGLVIISCSSIFLYLSLFQTSKRDIYYDESTHPHPTIRILWIIFTIVSYCSHSLKAKGIQIELDKESIIDNTFLICERVGGIVYENNHFINFKNTLKKERSNIIGYLQKLQKMKNKDNSLSVPKWNKLAREYHQQILSKK